MHFWRKSRSYLVTTFLIAVVPFTSSIAFSLPTVAADCGGYISGCIRNNASKPDSMAKCKAAGESCAKIGVFRGLGVGWTETREVRRCSRRTASP